MVGFSCCKINIGLDIVAKRPDGYHDVVTAMVPVPLHDVIEIVPSDAVQLTCLGRPVDCPPEKNLVMKAYQAMASRFSIHPYKIILQKIVPDGAGLGGGSADATATLQLINEAEGLELDSDKIAEIASTIGADCPFFAYNRPMLATGIGTTLRSIDINLSGLYLQIAKPEGVSISTKQAYAGVKPALPKEPLEKLLALPIEEWQGRVKNDFEPSIFAIAPQVRRLKEEMLNHGAVYSSMSGSGASVYGIFREEPVPLIKGAKVVRL
ncbi:MAG: 4-(cytidine 5'-diphospho)-2-C-methyl-D-erythritol kinase [Clostridium sp.]|nr:4-(cytidine 5'-diphospho)-2-C-methyl-D-erythritol kinase [Clostridium sp.]